MLSIKEKWEQKVGNHIWRIRSEYETPYIRLIDTLGKVLNLVKKIKTKLVPSTAIRNFRELRLTEIYSILLEAYIFHINWAFLYPRSDVVAEVLQNNFEKVVAIILEMQEQTKWIELKKLAKQILKSLGLSVSNSPINIAELMISHLISNFVERFELADVKKINIVMDFQSPVAIRLKEIGKKAIKNLIAHKNLQGK